MDSLKEKYLDLLKEGKENKPVINSPFLNGLAKIEMRMDGYNFPRLVRFPKFFKHTYVESLSLCGLTELKTLENAPECEVLTINKCPSLKNLKGARFKILHLRDSFGYKAYNKEFFEGFPEELDAIYMVDRAESFFNFIEAIETNIYKPKRIHSIISLKPFITDCSRSLLKLVDEGILVRYGYFKDGRFIDVF